MTRIPCTLFLCITASTLQAQDAAYDRCVQEAIRSGSPAGVAGCNLSRSQASMESSANKIIKALPSRESRPAQSTSSTARSSSTSKPYSRAGNLVDNLSKLSDMYEKGLLTEEEFQQAKRAALGLD